jgi:hypothetical protein
MKTVSINQSPKACDAEAARYERYLEEWKRDYKQTKEKRRTDVRNMTLHSALLMFQTFNEAMAARRELCAAGYDFRIREELDDCCHRTTFADAWRSSRARLDEDVLWEQLEAIIEPLEGEIVEAGLIEDPTLERQQHRLQ